MPDIFVGNKIAEDRKKHTHSHLFASYCENPPVNFMDKLPKEEVLLLLRRHLITNVPWIVVSFFLSLLPLLLYILIAFNFFSLGGIPPGYKIVGLLFYYSIILIYVFVNFFTWFYNISLVTTLRIIDIDFSSIVFENVAATKLTQVEDVSYSQIGVVRSIFDYGNVLVQTAAHEDVFEFLAVPHPEEVIKTINNLLGEAENA